MRAQTNGFRAACREQAGLALNLVLGGEIDLNTSQGRTMARVSVAMAAGSSDDTSERIVRQQSQRRAAGLPPGGYTPFGWKDKTTPDPARDRAAGDPARCGGSTVQITRSLDGPDAWVKSTESCARSCWHPSWASQPWMVTAVQRSSVTGAIQPPMTAALPARRPARG